MDRFFSRFLERGTSSHDLPPRLIDKHPEILDRTLHSEMYEYAKSKGETNLFGKLIDNLRFIDRQTFTDDLKVLGGEVSRFVGDHDYSLLINRKNKSEGWVFDQIDVLKPPIAVIDGFGSTSNPKSNADKGVFTDDGLYTGAHLNSTLESCIQEGVVKAGGLGIFLIGSTNLARKNITQDFNPVVYFYKYNIPTISEIFSSSEQKRLKKLFPSWSGSYEQAVLTFWWHKIPDNFIGGLKASGGEFLYDRKKDIGHSVYLFNDGPEGGFYPPYRPRR